MSEHAKTTAPAADEKKDSGKTTKASTQTKAAAKTQAGARTKAKAKTTTPPAKTPPEEETQTYTAVCFIRRGGKRIKPTEPIKLTDAEAEELRAAKAIT